jgi:hypothetical protein
VGVLTADERTRPLSVPVWYRYDPGGEIVVVTPRGPQSATVTVMRVAFCAVQEMPPKYVTIRDASSRRRPPT